MHPLKTDIGHPPKNKLLPLVKGNVIKQEAGSVHASWQIYTQLESFNVSESDNVSCWPGFTTTRGFTTLDGAIVVPL